MGVHKYGVHSYITHTQRVHTHISEYSVRHSATNHVCHLKRISADMYLWSKKLFFGNTNKSFILTEHLFAQNYDPYQFPQNHFNSPEINFIFTPPIIKNVLISISATQINPVFWEQPLSKYHCEEEIQFVFVDRSYLYRIRAPPFRITPDQKRLKGNFVILGTQINSLFAQNTYLLQSSSISQFWNHTLPITPHH